MVNYIWLALIVFALGIGAYRDLTKEPTSTTPPDRVVWTGSVAADGSDPAAAVNTALVANEGEGSVSTVKVKLAGELEGRAIVANVVDKEGEKFSVRCKVAGVSASFDPATLVAAPENAEAKADAPLTLASVAARGKQTESPVTVIEVSLAFATQHSPDIRADVRDASWMGVATKSSLYSAESAITLAISLIGAMMLWLGLMKIAEKSGLVQLVALALSPIMKLLFPDVPKGHPAAGSIVMNISANMLGLGNSATAMGLKAMKELQEINPNKAEASNAQVMFLALNTSGLQLVPAGILAYRSAAGAGDLMGFWPIMVAATTISTITAFIVVKSTENLRVFRQNPPEPGADSTTEVKA